jgi:multimeric flavodoxin WrbA
MSLRIAIMKDGGSMTADRPVAQVVGFAGSPRIGANSETLLDEVLRGAEEAGAAVEKFRLAKMQVGPCLACDACNPSGLCIQKDDMARLVDRMLESDLWVLATPVYWWGPSAQLKLFIDRWYGPWHNADIQRRLVGKRAVLVAAMGDTHKETARHVVGMLSDAFRYMHMDLIATLLAPDVNGRADVAGSQTLLSQAYEIGRSAVSAAT